LSFGLCPKARRRSWHAPVFPGRAASQPMKLRNPLKTKLKKVVAASLVRNGWRPPRGTPPEFLPGGKPLGYDEENLIREAVQRISGHTMSSFERLATLWHQVRYLDRYQIPGALVECGVWKGGSSAMMALAHLASSPVPCRPLHLFDSFEGLPEPRRESDGREAIQYSSNRAGGNLVSIQQCVGTLAENRQLLQDEVAYPEKLLQYHVGWFENTVEEAAPKIPQIALLRLDGDWYESTRTCLVHLYPHVVRGGVVVIDDYGHWEGCRKAVDEFLASLSEPILLNHIDYTGRYWIRVLGAA
jgi:O-methyltransferase